MFYMKKIYAILLICSLLFLLVSCNDLSDIFKFDFKEKETQTIEVIPESNSPELSNESVEDELNGKKDNDANDSDDGNDNDNITEAPTSYTVYFGSVMQSTSQTDIHLALNSVYDTRIFVSAFEKGKDRFMVMFPSDFATSLRMVANYESSFEQELMVGEYIGQYDGQYGDKVVRVSDREINGLNYRVYRFDVSRMAADSKMLIELR